MDHFVVMGVAGCGKSTVASLLAARLGAGMIEADELHGSANIEKMKRGEPLSDEDRWPWLSRVAMAMQTSGTPVFVSCSALRRSYRQYLLDTARLTIGFIHLHASREVLEQRMSGREGHFMPVALLDSQLRTLEPLQDDETGVVVNIAQSIEQVTDDAMQFVSAIR